MRKIYKKLIVSLFALFLGIWCGAVYAENPDNFSIEVNSSFNTTEAVDFTVVATKDGEWLKEYTWTILFLILDSNGNYLDSDFYTVPSHGFYDFVETDQWKKTFSKWLAITKAWTYTLEVDSLFPEWIIWKAVVNVAWDTGTSSFELVDISYPTNWSTETKQYVSVMWSCENLKNSPIVVYLNDKVVNSWYTDIKWWFNVSVQELISWDNTIQAKILDVNGVVLWESPTIIVKYKPVEDGVYSWIDIIPWKEWKQWDKFVFNVYTDDSVNSAQLIFSDWSKFSMDRIWQWLFSKELVATFSWNIDISVSLMQNLNEKIYENVSSIFVQENNAITNIKFTSTGIDGSQVIVSRETIWTIEKYKINYWTWKDDLINSETVSSSTILINNIQKDTTYYFQIIPMDAESHNSWEPSEIVEYHSDDLSCIVKGIKVRKEQIWDNYYLVRDPVENVTSYEVYKSDWADMTDARLVWNLTWTRFQYLFDKDATKDEYAYYQVQAICADWTTIIVDKAQKVKVWPIENMLLIIIISIFVYSLYRLHKISDERA